MMHALGGERMGGRVGRGYENNALYRHRIDDRGWPSVAVTSDASIRLHAEGDLRAGKRSFGTGRCGVLGRGVLLCSGYRCWVHSSLDRNGWTQAEGCPRVLVDQHRLVQSQNQLVGLFLRL